MGSIVMLAYKKEKELKEILKKYINQQATPSEREAIDHWYDTLEVAEAGQQNKRPLIRRLYNWYSAAAVLILLSAFGFWIYASNPVAKDILIRTAKTERKALTLADGTVVMLNTGSELLVSRDFNDKQRRVTLKGEAYFKVAKDIGRPFIISSGTLRTQVLGTSFNICAYPDRDRVKVSVLTGRVRVSKFQGKLERELVEQMMANQTISFFRKSGKFELNTEDAMLITSWRENKLYIDNASMRDIAQLLKGFYHMEVKDFSKSDGTDRYTIRFNRESMKSVLGILSHLTKRKFSYTNDQITIK